MSGQIRLRVRYRNYVGRWFDYLFVSKEEMEQILEGAGWKVTRFVESPNNPQYVALIEKVG